MAGGKKTKVGSAPKTGARPSDPEWAAGLKRLYDSVVDEPLPDAFKDLLNKLDAAD
jgi:anti-sigma factor NepR-like protein